MFKMDFSGNGVLIEQDKLNTAMDIRADSFTFDKFRYMCILSGCDYLASLYGIGLGKACKLFKLTKQMDMNVVRHTDIQSRSFDQFICDMFLNIGSTEDRSSALCVVNGRLFLGSKPKT